MAWSIGRSGCVRVPVPQRGRGGPLLAKLGAKRAVERDTSDELRVGTAAARGHVPDVAELAPATTIRVPSVTAKEVATVSPFHIASNV